MAGKCKDLSNQYFGDWYVLERAQVDNKHPYWKCQCKCGTIKNVRGESLTNGRSQSCGKCASIYSIKDNLMDKIFLKLKVIGYDQEMSKQKGRAYWITQCDCGTIKSYRASQLLDGSAQSCGCLRSSLEEQTSKVLNKYNIDYKKEYSFPDLFDNKPLYFDFALFKNNQLIALIECNGLQHYSPIEYFGGEEKFNLQQKHDAMKYDYCNNHHIPLYIIKYNDKIEERVIECLQSLN